MTPFPRPGFDRSFGASPLQLDQLMLSSRRRLEPNRHKKICHLITWFCCCHSQCYLHWSLVSATLAGATCTLSTAAGGGPRRLLFLVGATCTSSTVSAGLASRWVFGTTRKREAGGGQQAGKTKACQDLLELRYVHYPPPFQLMVGFRLSSQDRKNVARPTEVNTAHFHSVNMLSCTY